MTNKSEGDAKPLIYLFLGHIQKWNVDFFVCYFQCQTKSPVIMSDRRYRNIRSLKYGSIFLFLGLTVLAFILYTNNLTDLGTIKVEPVSIGSL